jgi:hypothetical protein
MSVDLIQYDQELDRALSRCMRHHFTNAFGPKTATIRKRNRKRKVQVSCLQNTSVDPLTNLQLKLHHRAFGNSESAKRARRCIVTNQEKYSRSNEKH